MTTENNHLAFFRGNPEQIDHLLTVADELGITSMASAEVHVDYGTLSHEERERQEGLDRSIRSALVPAVMSNAYQLTDRLWDNGIRTVRDVLVLGRKRLNHGTSDITRDQLDKINRAIEATYPNETLKDAPTIEDIAAICISIDQIHGGVLPAYTAYLKRRKSEILAQYRGSHIPPKFDSIQHYPASLKVGEFLADRFIAPPPTFYDRRPSDLLSKGDFQSIRTGALPFAFTFTEIRSAAGAN